MNELLKKIFLRSPHDLTAPDQDEPVALVYRGPASLPGCPEAVAKSLEKSNWNFDVRYVGPKEKLRLSQETLATAALYAQPGGEDLDDGYAHLKQHRRDIRRFVKSGGNYLGFCLGGYLAGASPGFGLLPGDTDAYIETFDAAVTTEENSLIQVSWRGERRELFFQDGPHFLINSGASVHVLATYTNKTIAALVADFGEGRVGVVGPHPEATKKWFTDINLTQPDRLGIDLALDLVDEVMSR